MNRKLFLILTSLLLIAIGTIVWFNFQSVSGTFSDSAFGISSEQLKRVELISANRHLILEKKDSLWYLQKPVEELADQEKVEGLIAEFSASKLVAPVSSNPKKQDLFGVDSISSKIVFDDKIFHIGNVGPDFKTTFVRQSGDDQVNIFTGLLASNITSNTDAFRFRQILKLDKKSVKSILITGLTESYTMLNDSLGWTINGQIIPSDKTNPLDETLFSLKGETVIDSIKTASLNRYVNTLNVSVSADKNYSLHFYKIPEKLSYFVVQDGSDRIYSIPEYLADRFFKPSSYWLTTEGK